MKVTKYVLPVVVGAMSGMILIVLGNNLVDRVYPPPAGTDKYDVASLNKAIKLMPDEGFRLLLINYAVGAFLAGGIAALIAGRTSAKASLIVGFVLMLSGLYYVANFQLPIWFAIINVIIYMPCAYLGYLTVRKKAAIE